MNPPSLLPVNANYVLAAVVVTMIVVELAVQAAKGQRIPVADSSRSAVIGLGYLGVRVMASSAIGLAAYLWLYQHARLFDLSWRTPWVWLAYWIIYKPLTGLWAPLLGFPPIMYPVMGAVSLIVGQLQHTELIGGLGPLDRVLMTPSNHRVHHASNPRYLDRNFGGHTAVWDHLFGTYEPETERPRYGLTHPLSARSPFTIAAGGYPELVRDLRGLSGAGLRLAACVGRPR